MALRNPASTEGRTAETAKTIFSRLKASKGWIEHATRSCCRGQGLPSREHDTQTIATRAMLPMRDPFVIPARCDLLVTLREEVVSEDLAERDRQYEERMEEEYSKREETSDGRSTLRRWHS
jgi:hypothetical protein